MIFTLSCWEKTYEMPDTDCSVKKKKNATDKLNNLLFPCSFINSDFAIGGGDTDGDILLLVIFV